jgi:hypothetical protein
MLATALATTTASVALAAGPTQQPPNIHLTSLGTLGAKAVPLHVTWPAATPNGAPIDHYELQVRRDNGTWTAVALPKKLAKAVDNKQAAWSVITYRVRAVDTTAAAGDWAESGPVWLSTAQENDESVSLTAGWTRTKRSVAFGGYRAITTEGSETATFAFTGREVGWVARLGPDAGSATVAPDGMDPAPVDLQRNKATNKRIVFSAVYPTNGAHSLTITTQASGPKVDIDAFVVLSDPTDETLVGAGDISSCLTDNDAATAAVLATVPGVVFTAGDNVYPDGASANYANCYDPTWGALKSRTRPVPGNHDYLNSPGAPGYFGYFGAAAGDPQTGWYRYDAGTWRIYALNSECTTTTCPQQLEWLKQQLASEPHLCTLAIWHRPRFSTGAHGNSMRMDAAWQLLGANHADVIVGGHDHTYERYTPLDGAGNPDVNGMREFVVGTGGAELYKFKTDDTRVEMRQNTEFGVLRLDLEEGTYSWQFLSATGTFTDSGTGTCH